MTTLRHQLLDAQGNPIAGKTATVVPYRAQDTQPGEYHKTTVVSAVSDNSGWLSWQLPAKSGAADPATYVVTGIETAPVLIAVPSGVSTVLVAAVRTGTLAGPPHDTTVDLVTELELSRRLSQLSMPPTTAQLAADPTLRAALDARYAPIGAGVGTALTVASTVTTAGALVASKHNPVDATAGALTVTLPTGTSGKLLAVEKVDATTNAVTVSGSLRGSASTIALVWAHETLLLASDSSGSWWPVAGHKTKASLDGAYVPFKSLALNPDLLISGTIARDANGAATSAPVVWPDGSPGTYTADTVSTAFPGAVDAYHVTYGSPVTKTYTQPAVTRDATSGAVTVRPALTVA